MAELPSASVTIDPEGGTFGAGVDYLVVMGAVGTNGDGVPRVFTSTKALLSFYNYAPAIDYCAMHFEETKKPIIFVGMEAETLGTIGQQDDSQVDGSSTITVTGDPLEEMDISLTVTEGGTVGTDRIRFDLSLDGGDTVKSVRLGTATSYAVPYVGITFHFGAGTLEEDDLYTCKTTPPRWEQPGLADARDRLAAQLKPARSWLIVGDLEDGDDAEDVLAEVNGYETENTRFVYARCQVRDQRPLVQLAHRSVKMSGNPTLTFLEVGGTGDTITRSGGSWIDDGFAVGDVVVVAGSASNNVTGAIAALSATVLTFDGTDLANEGPVADCTVTGYAGLTFAEAGASDTITRSSGSWLLDGFRVGDTVTVTGTASNNVTGPIAALSAHVLTFDGTTDLAAEVIGAHLVEIVGTLGEEMADWVSNIDADFDGIDAQKRIDLGAGRARKLSPITGYKFRRPVSWAASLREYQHDVHITCWEKDHGPLSGWDLEDDDGNIVEYDERTQGGLLAARFTCFRTYANGPAGAFIALSLTRDSDNALLSRTHNMAVANVFQTVVQNVTENMIGRVLEVNDDGTGTEASLVELEELVNTALAIELLQDRKEGKRASDARWSASRTDVLKPPPAELTGMGDLELNGTLEKISTRTRVR